MLFQFRREREMMKMMKLRSKKYFCRSIISKNEKKKKMKGVDDGNHKEKCSKEEEEIKWEMRPGGMLVQRRDTTQTLPAPEPLIAITVSTVSHCHHHISITPTSTFGELKTILSLRTGLEEREQRVLFKGRERDEGEYLHMVGVRDKDKLLLLQDPAIQAMKMLLSVTPNSIITV